MGGRGGCLCPIFVPDELAPERGEPRAGLVARLGGVVALALDALDARLVLLERLGLALRLGQRRQVGVGLDAEPLGQRADARLRLGELGVLALAAVDALLARGVTLRGEVGGFKIGKQLFMITSPLDSDAAGLGYLQVSPNIRTPFADNEPVIFHKPMGRFMLASDSAGYSTRAGRISTMTLEFEEALD